MADPAALVRAGAYDPAKEAPTPIRRYLEGGAAPSTFGRDARTAANQVPRWAWGTLAAAFAGMAWFAWKRDQPEKKSAGGST